MIPIIAAVGLMLSSTQAVADCGVEGTFQERVASCSKTSKELQLVMSKDGNEYWFSPNTRSIFQVVAAPLRDEAKKACQALKEELKLSGVRYDWDLAVSNELTRSVVSIYPQLKGTGGSEDERRFWLGDLYDHPSGKKWSSFYSTKGYIDSWFSDASDGWYAGGICSMVLN